MRIIPFQFALLPVIALIAVASAACADLGSPGRYRAAYIGDNDELFIADSTNGLRKQITTDGIPKNSLCWSPDGREIAYLADTKPNLALPTLVVRNLEGEVMAQQTLFPGRSPGEIGGEVAPTALSIDKWIDKRHLALEGKLSRWACVFLVVEPYTGERSKEQAGDCGTFGISPDGSHIFALANLRAGMEEAWRDYLIIDSVVTYPAKSSDIRFMSQPVWSPDSRQIAVVERVISSGAKNLIIIDTSGERRQTPLPISMSDVAEIEWVGADVVFTDGTFRLSVRASDHGELLQASVDQVDALARRETERQRGRVGRQSVNDDLLKKVTFVKATAVWMDGAKK